MALQEFKAAELRVEGMSHQEISTELGIPLPHVKLAIARAMKVMRMDTNSKKEDLVDIEMMRLDRIISVHMANLAAPRSAELVIKTMERRARFLGLDIQPDSNGESAADALRSFMAAARDATGASESPTE